MNPTLVGSTSSVPHTETPVEIERSSYDPVKVTKMAKLLGFAAIFGQKIS